MAFIILTVRKLATIQGQSFPGTGKLLKNLLLIFQS